MPKWSVFFISLLILLAAFGSGFLVARNTKRTVLDNLRDRAISLERDIRTAAVNISTARGETDRLRVELEDAIGRAIAAENRVGRAEAETRRIIGTINDARGDAHVVGGLAAEGSELIRRIQHRSGKYDEKPEEEPRPMEKRFHSGMVSSGTLMRCAGYIGAILMP